MEQTPKYTWKEVTLPKARPMKEEKRRKEKKPGKHRPLWLTLVIYAVIVIALVVGIPWTMSVVLGTSSPMAVITSNSMWPNLTRGDLVFLTGVQKDQLAVGDVIAFYDSSGITIHRVAEIKADSIITKGDANAVNDKPITYERIIGKAVPFGSGIARIPWLGQITIWYTGS